MYNTKQIEYRIQNTEDSKRREKGKTIYPQGKPIIKAECRTQETEVRRKKIKNKPNLKLGNLV